MTRRKQQQICYTPVVSWFNFLFCFSFSTLLTPFHRPILPSLLFRFRFLHTYVYTQLSGHGLGGCELDTRILLPKGSPHQIVIDCVRRSLRAVAVRWWFRWYVGDMVVLLKPEVTGTGGLGN